MALTTVTGAAILRPELVDELLVQPVLAQSVAAQVSRIVQIESKSFRIPRITADATAQWVAEGAEITPSDAAFAETTVTPAKVAGLTVVTRELADDSSPEAARVVGESLARDISRQIDAAYFGNLSAPAPAGLGSLATTGANTVTVVSAGTSWTSVDAFLEARFKAADLGTEIGAWCANPADALLLSKIKQSSGSQQNLLSPDPTSPATRVIDGTVLLTSPSVPTGIVWGIPADRSVFVIRTDAEILTDRSVFFTSDRVAVRAVTRAAFGFPHPAALVRIRMGA